MCRDTLHTQHFTPNIGTALPSPLPPPPPPLPPPLSPPTLPPFTCSNPISPVSRLGQRLAVASSASIAAEEVVAPPTRADPLDECRGWCGERWGLWGDPPPMHAPVTCEKKAVLRFAPPAVVAGRVAGTPSPHFARNRQKRRAQLVVCMVCTREEITCAPEGCTRGRNVGGIGSAIATPPVERPKRTLDQTKTVRVYVAGRRVVCCIPRIRVQRGAT